jgi:hypothetical protein
VLLPLPGVSLGELVDEVDGVESEPPRDDELVAPLEPKLLVPVGVLLPNVLELL